MTFRRNAQKNEGVQRNIAYSAMTLLPYSDKAFSCYQSASAQETRFGIGQQIQASIILSRFVEKLETVKKSCTLITWILGQVLNVTRQNCQQLDL